MEKEAKGSAELAAQSSSGEDDLLRASVLEFFGDKKSVPEDLVSLVFDYVAGGACDKCRVVDEYEEFVSLDCMACLTRLESSLCETCATAEEKARGDTDLPPTRVFIASVEIHWGACGGCGGSLCNECSGSMMKCLCADSYLCPFCYTPAKCNMPSCDVKTGTTFPLTLKEGYWTAERLQKFKWNGDPMSLPVKREQERGKEAINARYWTYTHACM
mmetsp:Transcript_12046/g.21979  ORF Transcript_12046/g.21979 Transcript_12046/m.21979 type:complete len:216 (+) Transcript_12046:257-904(+)|eukprot:CAMPEP_0197535062 /NCGR_PEP_ID=MMETSP1318-20131121/49297_1 /TAXON_ID=552666 /ORGANISM="Partenskyella glossopodia, Strain RCC365" /LENGTH=215 /DNA_ID=CAMNT_0043092541 /DNA_START=139 /DNA_END=786 /DNA_ORIENTATION=-